MFGCVYLTGLDRVVEWSAVLTSYCVEVVTDTPSCPTCSAPPNDGSEGYYGFAGSWSEYMSCNNGQQPQVGETNMFCVCSVLIMLCQDRLGTNIRRVVEPKCVFLSLRTLAATARAPLIVRLATRPQRTSKVTAQTLRPHHLPPQMLPAGY